MGGGQANVPCSRWGVAAGAVLIATPAALCHAQEPEPAAAAAVQPAPPSAPAQPTPPPGPVASTPRDGLRPIRTPIEVPLTLNDKFLGSVSVEVDVAGDGAVDAPRLLELLRPAVDPALATALEGRIAGRRKVDFADLRDEAFTVAFDPLTLGLAASVKAGGLAESQVRLTNREPAPNPGQFDRQSDFAAGLNLSAGQRYLHERDGGFQPLRASAAGFLNVGGFDGVTLTGGIDYDASDESTRWRRREFRLTKDFYGRAVRATLGEFTPYVAGFQGSGRVFGIGVERAYSTIRPFQNIRPVGRQTFTLERESLVEVFINDVRSETLRLAAGRYDVADFPFAAGPNRVRIEVEDNAGRREVAAFDIFSDASLLNPGVVEFGVGVGFREGRRSLEYRTAPVATGYVQKGLNDNLTMGAHAQLAGTGAQAGLIAIWGSRLGFVQSELAVSRSGGDGALGGAVSIDYRGEFSLLSDEDVRINVTGLYRSPRFQDAFTVEGRNPIAWQAAARAQWRAPLQLSVGLGYGFTKARGAGFDVTRYDVTIGRTFGRFGLNATASRSNEDIGRYEWRGALGLSIQLGRRWYGTARYESRERRAEIEITRPSDGTLGDIGGGIRLGNERSGRNVSGYLSYIHNRFDAELEHNRLVSSAPDGPRFAETSWNVSSFLGYAGGSFGIGRSAGEAFVIAPVHDSLDGARVQIKSGNRVIARSGVFGPALVPIGRAYGIQRFEVGVDPLPPGYDLGSGVINVFPGYGAGYEFPIGSDASRIAVGSLVEDGKPLSLGTGTVERIGAKEGEAGRPFFTNRAGRFVADGLAPGRYRIVIGGKPRAEFTVPEKGEGMVDVGTITLEQP